MNNLREKITEMIKKDKKRLRIMILGLSGMLLLLFSGDAKDEAPKENSASDISAVEKSIEEKQHTAIFEVGRNAQKYASAIRENGYKQWEKAHNQEKEAHTRNLQQRAKGMEMGL